MCRNIKPLFNFNPTATEAEIQGAALQFVRKVSGFYKPSQANADAFDDAVKEIARATQTLLDTLITTAPIRNRDVENAKAKVRSEKRFAQSS